jgi:transcriptional regulator with GAF, ATPase, and Fis domain
MKTHEMTGYKLKVTTKEGHEFYDLRGETITVGRARDNNLILRDIAASRYHFKLESTGDEWRVVDVGSQNGTLMNGRKVRRASFKLGDVIQVGSTKITIEKKVSVEQTLQETVTTELNVHDGATLGAGEDSLGSAAMERLQQVARALNSELQIEALLSLVIDSAIELTGAERGFLILVGKKEMEFRVARNFERQSVAAPEFAVSWSVATQVSTSGQAVLCVNAAEDERFATQESVGSLGLRSVMCVPFKVKSRVLGVVYVDNRLHKGAFTKRHFRILETLADQAAIALENARLYNEMLDQKRALEDVNQRLNLQVQEQDSRLRARRVAEGQTDGETPMGRPGLRGSIIGESPAVRDLFALIKKVAGSDLPVLVTGESGTGKELVAQAVHRLSRRAQHKIVAENCCAIPETLLESELFGYKKGAFTGANTDHPGLFEVASRGTLFLDEIGDLSANLQTKLLRALQEGEIRPIGSKSAVKVDVRLITSTNRDLPALIQQGLFREDLYYRIKVVSIVVPPLRRRKDDIPALVEHFLALFAAETATSKKAITKEALETLKAYHWPGNVRELENEVRTMVSLAGETIDKVDVPSHIFDQVELMVGQESSFHDLNELVESIETREITKALRRARGNKTKAAELLGITRFALQRKLEKYQINEEEAE